MSHKKTTKEFIFQCQQKFGTEKFDYTTTNYIKNDFKVDIRCILHNLIFSQTPSNHLIFNGCSKCLEESQRKLFQKTTEKFIQQATERHGNKYDYSKTIYINNHTKVSIICPLHGQFEVTPINHLKSDCQKCGFDKLQGGYFDKYFERHPEAINKPAILYFVQFRHIDTDNLFYKLGVTTKDIDTRFSASVYKNFLIETIWKIPGTLMKMYKAERQLLKINQAIRIRVNYPNFSGSTECFSKILFLD